MNETLLALLIWLPLILVAIGSAILWRRLQFRALFIVVGTLSVLGLQALAAPAALAIFVAQGGDMSSSISHSGFVRSVQFSALLVAVGGVIVLWWLGRVLSKSRQEEANAA